MTWLFRSCQSPGSSSIVKDNSSHTAAWRSSASSCAAVMRGTSGSFCAASTNVREYWVVNLPSCRDRKSTRLNSSHVSISYAVFCLKKKKNINTDQIEKQKQKFKKN